MYQACNNTFSNKLMFTKNPLCPLRLIEECINEVNWDDVSKNGNLTKRFCLKHMDKLNFKLIATKSRSINKLMEEKRLNSLITCHNYLSNKHLLIEYILAIEKFLKPKDFIDLSKNHVFLSNNKDFIVRNFDKLDHKYACRCYDMGQIYLIKIKHDMWRSLAKNPNLSNIFCINNFSKLEPLIYKYHPKVHELIWLNEFDYNIFKYYLLNPYIFDNIDLKYITLPSGYTFNVYDHDYLLIKNKYLPYIILKSIVDKYLECKFIMLYNYTKTGEGYLTMIEKDLFSNPVFFS